MTRSDHECGVCGETMQQCRPWLFHCRACGFWQSTLEAGAGTGIEGLEDLRRRNNAVILDRLERRRPLDGMRVLEIGSAWGWFLEDAANRGARVHGIEPEAANVTLSRQKFGDRIEHGFFPSDLKDRGPYDLVVFNDVFEHIPCPAGVIEAVEKILAPNGLVVINLPSSDGFFFRMANLLDAIGIAGPLERLWLKGFSSPHLSFFNRTTLQRLVRAKSSLGLVEGFPLVPIGRKGLYDRIRATHRGMPGLVLFAAIWLATFVLPLLPADNDVAIFEAKGPKGPAG